jgi:hypothetical protein
MIVLAAALLVATSSAGCVVLPAPHGGNQFAAMIGAADSAAAIKVGVSDRSQVVAALAEPYMPGLNVVFLDAPWVYCDRTTTAVLIYLWPFVHGGIVQPINREDMVAIWFGRDGKVRRYDTWCEPPDETPPDVAAWIKREREYVRQPPDRAPNTTRPLARNQGAEFSD